LTNQLSDLFLFVHNKTNAKEILEFIDDHNGVVYSAIRNHLVTTVKDTERNCKKINAIAYPLNIMIGKGFIYKYKSKMRGWTMYGDVRLYKITDKGKEVLNMLKMFEATPTTK